MRRALGLSSATIAPPTPGVTFVAMSAIDGAATQPCASCGQLVDVTGLEPFSKVDCPHCGAPMRVARTFENYEVVEPLGTGGMGSVFKARDTKLNRFVALKLLRREFAGDQSFTEKLQEEARITGSIRHPHVVEVYAVGSDGGQFYVVMELVDRGSLDDRIEDEKQLGELRTLELGLQIAQGLQAALKAGLIHRDIKPGNILFADANTAKIVDFGLAWLAEKNAEAQGGEIWGTPYYIAPERLTGKPEDFRSDLYSLGATLFHAIAGHTTFEAETMSAAELRSLKEHPPKLQVVVPQVSDETAAVIDRMLRPDPADRQSSYKELIDELQAARAALLAREEELRARWSWPVRLLALVGVLVVAAGLLYGGWVGLYHLPDWRSHVQLPWEKTAAPQESVAVTPAVDFAKDLPAARHELAAGHYATAEALFHQLAAARPELAPAADLAAGLQLWERGEFASAATSFQKFVARKPAPAFPWIKDLQPLAADRLHDYQLAQDWQRTRAATRDPAEQLRKLRAVMSQLRTKGALAFELADEEAKLTAQVAEIARQHAAEDAAHAAIERPQWEAALTAARRAEASYQFEAALAALQKVPLTAESLEAARADEVQRARWLADWKTMLIGDINRTGYGGAVTDVHGIRYDGPVRHATAQKIELKTRYGSVMTDWRNLPPPMLLTIARAFIRLGAADVAEREWLSAMFAQATGQTDVAAELGKKAAAAKAEFRELLPRFLPAAK